MPKGPEKPYQPSREEIKKAEEMMTPEEKGGGMKKEWKITEP